MIAEGDRQRPQPTATGRFLLAILHFVPLIARIIAISNLFAATHCDLSTRGPILD